MSSGSIGLLAPSLDSSAETARRLRNRGLANVLRMGHCAPSIMQAMLDVIEAVGHDGTFLAEAHTVRRFRKELWFPKLLDRQY